MTALQICKAALEDASKALEQLSQIGPGHWPTTGRIVAEAGAKARAALEAAAKVGGLADDAHLLANISGMLTGNWKDPQAKAGDVLQAIDAYQRGAR